MKNIEVDMGNIKDYILEAAKILTDHADEIQDDFNNNKISSVDITMFIHAEDEYPTLDIQKSYIPIN